MELGSGWTVGIWKAELSGFAGALAVCPPGGDHSLLGVFISAHSRSIFHLSFFLYSLLLPLMQRSVVSWVGGGAGQGRGRPCVSGDSKGELGLGLPSFLSYENKGLLG